MPTGTTADPRSQAIVASTISLARSLRLAVVAEGVETEAVRDLLARLGCDVAQGYLFSRPVPADRLQPGVVHGGRVVPGWGRARGLPAATRETSRRPPAARG